MKYLLLKIIISLQILTMSFSAHSFSSSKKNKSPMVNTSPKETQYVAGELILSFKTDKDASNRKKLYAKYNVTEKEMLFKGVPENSSKQIFLIQIPDPSKLHEVKKKIAAEPSVNYAEPNVMMHTLRGGSVKTKAKKTK